MEPLNVIRIIFPQNEQNIIFNSATKPVMFYVFAGKINRPNHMFVSPLIRCCTTWIVIFLFFFKLNC